MKLAVFTVSIIQLPFRKVARYGFDVLNRYKKKLKTKIEQGHVTCLPIPP